MAKKHLRELLCEEQEPFFLIDYINERRSQLQKPEVGLRLCRKKMASSVSPALSEVIRRRSASCFFAKRSPLFEFSERSPCRQSGPMAAGFLLNTALKIQEEAKDARPRNKIGYFGSILRRLVMRKRSRKRDSPKSLLRWELSEKETKMVDGVVVEKGVSEVRFSCSCNSSVWTESVEEKSMDLESSCSESEEFEGMEFIKERRQDRFPFEDAVGFCSSPFHFSVTPSSLDSGLRTPDFSSPRRSSSHSRSEVCFYFLLLLFLKIFNKMAAFFFPILVKCF